MKVSRNLVIASIVAVLLVALLIVVFVGEQSRMEKEAMAQTGKLISRGARLYDQYCAGCHGARGEGLAGVYPPLNVDNLWEGRDDVAFYGTIHDFVYLNIAAGHPAQRMPSWSQDFGGPLRNDQIEDLTQFVLNWQGEQPEGVRPEGVAARPTEAPEAEATPSGPAEPVADGDPVNGEAVYTTNCASCHGPDAAGGALGPSLLRPEIAAQDDGFYREVILKGRTGAAMPAWEGILSAQEIEDTVAWIRSKQ